MPDIFEYYDYHKYLLDFYTEKKGTSRYFSYRYMGRQLGIDAGYLVKVLQGQKNLSYQSAPRVAALLKLNKKETEYFKVLVLFGKTKSNTEIAEYFEKLLHISETKRMSVDADKYEFYKKWYYSVVREVIGFLPFNGDYKALAEMILPPITPGQAKKSVELLERLDLIKKNGGGVYAPTERFITTGEKWRSIAIRQFQEETILLAKTALDAVHKDERDISTITLSVSREGYEEIKEILKQTRRQVFEVAEKDHNANGAFQLNLQLFPISKKGSEQKQEGHSHE
jgi:uncharacterized protein (TIGR02147 family)